MVSSSSFPDRPSRRGSLARGGVLFGCSSIADVITTFEALLFGYLGPAQRAVKSRFNNTVPRDPIGPDAGSGVEMFKVNGHRRSVGRLREDKDPTFFCNTPRLLNYSQLMSRSKEPSVGRPATLTKRGRSLISRANCPR